MKEPEPAHVFCKDCVCNWGVECRRFPPTPVFACNDWYVKYPPISSEDQGCFSGIKSEGLQEI